MCASIKVNLNLKFAPESRGIERGAIAMASRKQGRDRGCGRRRVGAIPVRSGDEERSLFLPNRFNMGIVQNLVITSHQGNPIAPRDRNQNAIRWILMKLSRQLRTSNRI
jgi:hypothetical protein